MSAHKTPDNEWIESYLLGKLTEEEVREFLVWVENDREFARKLRLMKMFPEMMSEAGKYELSKQQSEVANQEARVRQQRLLNRRILYWTAISAIVLAVILILFLFLFPARRENQAIMNKKGNSGASVGNLEYHTGSPSKVPDKNPSSHPEPNNILSGNLSTQQPQIKSGQEVTQSAKVSSGRQDIMLLTPGDGGKFSQNETLRFSWSMKTDTFTRFYLVSEPAEKVVLWKGIRPGVRGFEYPGKLLYPGKYYWYVGTKEQTRSIIIY